MVFLFWIEGYPSNPFMLKVAGLIRIDKTWSSSSLLGWFQWWNIALLLSSLLLTNRSSTMTLNHALINSSISFKKHCISSFEISEPIMRQVGKKYKQVLLLNRRTVSTTTFCTIGCMICIAVFYESFNIFRSEMFSIHTQRVPGAVSWSFLNGSVLGLQCPYIYCIPKW